jgi:ABC-2 type transport system permease protein
MSAPVVRSPLVIQEIRGPSALSGGWRRFFNLTWMISTTDFKLTYFGSVLGYLWSLMRPLLFFGVLYFVFTEFVRFGGQIKDYPVFLLLNIVLISFFLEATSASVQSVVLRENLVRKMHFPRLVIPTATVLTSGFNLLVNLLAVFVFALIYGLDPRVTWLLLPVLLVPLILFTMGVSLILSSLYVRYRDVSPIWSVVSQMLFYGSPVFYAANLVGPTKARVLLINPVADILTQARRWMIDPTAPGIVKVIGGGSWLLMPAAVLVGTCAIGFWVFNREAPRIAEEL